MTRSNLRFGRSTLGSTMGGTTNLAMMGIVACTSYLLGSLTQWSLSSRMHSRQSGVAEPCVRDHDMLTDTAVPMATVVDGAVPPCAEPATDEKNGYSHRSEVPRDMTDTDSNLHREFYGVVPAVGVGESSSSTYNPVSVDAANTSRWFDWASHRPSAPPFDPTMPGALNISYESCVASLRGFSTAKTLRRRIHWLHFPKCGTSFGAVIYGYVCQYEKSANSAPPDSNDPGYNCTYCGRKGKNANKPTLWDPHLRRVIPFEDGRGGKRGMTYCDWSVPVPHFPFTNHFAHAWDWNSKRYRDAPVALFRDPRRRAASAWNNNKHSFGIGTFYNPLNKSEARRRINAIQTVHEFARYPAIQSCQTKMLLGEYCGEYVNITREMMREAVRRVLNLEFVGLTDAFNASVCLWHHQFGGVPREWMFQSVGKVRSGAYMFEQSQMAKESRDSEFAPLPGGGERAHPSIWKQIPIEYDPLDRQVYEVAKELFVARLQKYGLWHPDYRAMKVLCRGGHGPSPPC